MKHWSLWFVSGHLQLFFLLVFHFFIKSRSLSCIALPFFPASTLVAPFCVLPRLPMEPLAFLLPLLRLCRQMTHCVACGPPIGRPELQTVQRGNWSCFAEAKSPICNFSVLSGLMLGELAESVQWLGKCLSFRHVNMLPSVYNSLRPAKPARIKFKMSQWKSRATN